MVNRWFVAVVVLVLTVWFDFKGKRMIGRLRKAGL
jgi:hypothetical protein